MKFLRIIRGYTKSDRIRNATIQNEMTVEPLEEKVQNTFFAGSMMNLVYNPETPKEDGLLQGNPIVLIVCSSSHIF